MGPDDHPRRFDDPQMQPSPLRVRPPSGPPPLPPKTPLPEHQQPWRVGAGAGAGAGAVYGRSSAPALSSPSPMLPYPLDEEAPPMVNMARKPNYSAR
jgi:hypothetical protein